ncbi:hypothetical protein BGX34_000137 [Mortierella sp. NVP85]|nr:hypothetical protein BGX34_000137 [Mortierella sp. NVP85]
MVHHTPSTAFKSACSQWKTNLRMGHLHRKEPPQIKLGIDGRTRELAFLAALYLKSRLTMKKEDLQTWCPSPTYDNLYIIAKEIRCTEPRFRGYNPSELMDHFNLIVMHYRTFEEKLQSGAYPDWVPTRFSSVARELSILDYNAGFDELRRERNECLKRKRIAKKRDRRLGGLSQDALVSLMVTRSQVKKDDLMMAVDIEKLNVDFGNLKVDFGSLAADLRNLNVDFGKLSIDFGSLAADLRNLNVDFGKLSIDFGNLAVDLRNLSVEFGNLSVAHDKDLYDHMDLGDTDDDEEIKQEEEDPITTWLVPTQTFEDIFVKTGPSISVKAEPHVPIKEPDVFFKTELDLSLKAEPEVSSRAQPDLFFKAKQHVLIKTEPDVFANKEPEVFIKAEPDLFAKAEPEVLVKAEPGAFVKTQSDNDS